MFGIWKWFGFWASAGKLLLILPLFTDEAICAGAGGGWDCFVIARGRPTRPVPAREDEVTRK